MSAATLDSIPAPQPLDVDELEPVDFLPPEPVTPAGDDLAPDVAPSTSKRSRSRKSATPRERKPQPSRARGAVAANKSKRIAESVAGLHGLAGELLLPMAGMPVTGAALVAQADDAGKVWAQLALRYPAIERLFTASGDGLLFAQLVMVYAPVLTAALSERASSSGDDAALQAAAVFLQTATPASSAPPSS